MVNMGLMSPTYKQDRHENLRRGCLERLPTIWNHVIVKEALKFTKLEHVLTEKAGQLF
jgi:hypothetical protein